MLTTFIILGSAGFVATIAGAVWLVSAWGQGLATRKRRGQVEVSGEAEGSYAEVKELARAGNWRRAAPAFLAIGGLFVTLIATGLALFVGLEDRLFGAVLLGVMLFAAAYIGFGFIRA